MQVVCWSVAVSLHRPVARELRRGIGLRLRHGIGLSMGRGISLLVWVCVGWSLRWWLDRQIS